LQAIQQMHQRRKRERLPSQSAVASSTFSFARTKTQLLSGKIGHRSRAFRTSCAGSAATPPDTDAA
jgi:hypothetical protein